EGTQRYLAARGVPAERVFKVGEGRPNIVDLMISGGVQLLVNTPLGMRSQYDDFAMRRAAIAYKVPYCTTMSAAAAACEAVIALPPGAQPPGALRGGDARGEARRRGGVTSTRRRPPPARSHHKRTRPSTSPNVSSRIARTPVAASAPIRPSVVTATAVGVPLTLYSSSTSEPC